MQRAQTVRKARMLGSLIGIKCQPQLLDAPQTLKFSRIDEPDEKISFIRIGVQANDIVNRVAVDSFRQMILSPARPNG